MKIRVGIIGSGRIGMRHADAYKKILNAELVGFADNIPKHSQQLSNLFNKKNFSSPQEMIEDKSIDAIHVCSPNSSHATVSIDILKSGKHVLVEKPMALTLKDCDKMIKESKKNRVNLMVGHTFRFYPSSQKTKQILNSNKIGKPLIIQDYVLTSPKIIPQSHIPKWDKKRISETGALLDAIHHIDKLRFWLSSEISSVYTSFKGRFNISQKFEQIGMTTLNFRNGTSATLSFISSPWGMSEINTKIIGNKGILYVKYGEDIRVGKKSWKSYSFDYKSTPPSYDHNLQGFVNEISEFISSIHNSRTPSVSGKEGRQNLSIILSMYESFEKKRIIEIK